eukprot:jgi/Chrzof1/8099/UNPLg00144.t1
MRLGVPTAISHGMWLNIPDYDAPTQLSKPRERNTRYVDAVQTIPKDTLYPMCGMNLAFDRQAIGAAMYFGLQGQGYPLGPFDDMFAGWISKKIIDQLGLGVKTGLPYVWHSKASNPFDNLRKEYNGICWLEDLVPFFQGLKLTKTTAEECMLEVADAIENDATLATLHTNYFKKLAAGMRVWVSLWRELNATP